ncbi:DUF3179 domain-containing protein [Nocardia sp. NBC_00881]|uniref:DUF3179 domain-containing (seleno)protein n=1 Tax=Nocardia sp. NBC_00881 TaxID=2975995 RepID=UPI003863071E|nr:DUF3179 domain-containing protein [Nocardia sp. NBC_00881]
MSRADGFSPARKRPWFLPLNNPPVVDANRADHMRDDDPVVGVLVGAQARAYPWWILANHHLVNDTFLLSEEPEGYLWTEAMTGTGEPGYPWFPTTPVVLSLCEACSATSAFVPIPDSDGAQPLVFSLVERTANSPYRALGTFTIADVETHSRWHPFTGRAHSGPLAGAQLRRLPAFIDHWGTWSRDFPATTVALAGDEMRTRPHVADLPGVLDPDAAHTSLREVRLHSPALIDHRLPPTELVLGAGDAATGAAVAIPVAALRSHGGVLQTELAGRPLLFTLAGDFRGLVFERELDEAAVEFRPGSLVDHLGGTWDHLGACHSGPHRGRQLSHAPDGYLSKWSEWSLAHPGADIIG